MCVSVLLFQAVASAGAIRRCYCRHGDGANCCSPSRPVQPSAGCCCSHKAEATPSRCGEPRVGGIRSCCDEQRTGAVPCRCSMRSEQTQVYEPYRVRCDRAELLPVSWVDVSQVASAGDFSNPGVQPCVIWNPGVRLQSLFCVWLI